MADGRRWRRSLEPSSPRSLSPWQRDCISLDGVRSGRMGEWYHGSQQVLTVLRVGSTITRRRRLAEAFSHRPSRLSMGADGQIRHNGTSAGWLHIVDEPLSAEDIYPHPQTALGPGE